MARIAFSAVKTRTLDDIAGKVTVIFNHVYTNIGDCYDSDSGIFTASIRGMYFLTMNAEASDHEDHEPTRFDMRRGGHTFCSATFGPDTWMTGGNSAVILLEQGQEVRVVLVKGRLSSYTEFPISSFSGYLLYSL